MYFRDIIGQEEVKQHLIASAKSGVVPHAQLLCGQGGYGTFALALAYARYLNCTQRSDTDACGHCPSCKMYDELAHPDLHFVFPIVSKKEKKKEICDDMVLGTIQSRAQRLNVRAIHADDIKRFMQEKYALSAEDAEYVAHLSRGNYLVALDAISVNDEKQFYLEQFKAIMRNSWARNVKAMKVQADTLAAIGREKQKNFLAYCQHLIRENFVYRFQAPELNYMNRDEATFSVRFSPFVNERNVFGLMEELELAERQITQNLPSGKSPRMSMPRWSSSISPSGLRF